MAQDINRIGVKDLLEKTKLSDEDILIVEDTENTKRISFRDLRDSLITDDELPSQHRIYSSYKVDESINTFQDQLDTGIGGLKNSVEYITKNYSTSKDVDKKIEDFSVRVPELAETEMLKTALGSKRNSSDTITCNDLESGENSKKIQVRNLSKEVLSMMTGETPITMPGVPTGGWVNEDYANESISCNKLNKQYRYRGYYTAGNVNNFTKDGLYLLGPAVAGLPKYDAQESDLERLLEVYNYGPNQNIIQKLYYCIEDEGKIRPVYTRKAALGKLHVTDFVAEYPITDNHKITHNILDDNIFDCGTISSGSVYDLTKDGDYLVKKGVKNLPNENYDFTVSVRKYDTRIEYYAKAVTYNACELYISNTYLISSGARERTDWYKINNVQKSDLDGKRLHLFGDGVCCGLGSTDITTYSFPALLNTRYGLSIINHALGDATIGSYDDEYLAERSVITQIDSAQINNGDFAIIFAGSEDYKSGIAKIGNNSDASNYSFKGALNLAIQKLLQKNSNIKILVISPIFRARLDANDFRNSDDTPINRLYLRDYANAMKEVSEINHVPFLDLYSSCMINKYNFSKYLGDGLYPNNNGHDMLCNKIFSALDYFY